MKFLLFLPLGLSHVYMLLAIMYVVIFEISEIPENSLEIPEFPTFAAPRLVSSLYYIHYHVYSNFRNF